MTALRITAKTQYHIVARTKNSRNIFNLPDVFTGHKSGHDKPLPNVPFVGTSVFPADRSSR